MNEWTLDLHLFFYNGECYEDAALGSFAGGVDIGRTWLCNRWCIVECTIVERESASHTAQARSDTVV